MVQRPLGQELHVLVDGEDQVLPRLWLALAGTQDFAARIHGGEHAAGGAMQLAVELLLDAAEAVVVDADIAQHLRGDFVVGVEALELFLEVDAFESEGPDARRSFRRDAARDPGKTVPGGEPRGNLLLSGLRIVGVSVDEGGEGVRRGLLVVDLGGHRVDGVGLDGHGQLTEVAVIEDAAAGSHLKGARLLLLGAVNKLLVTDDLEPEEAAANDAGPDEKEQADEPEPRALEGNGTGRSGAVADGANGWLHER